MIIILYYLHSAKWHKNLMMNDLLFIYLYIHLFTFCQMLHKCNDESLIIYLFIYVLPNVI